MVHDLGIVVPDVGANGWKGQVFLLKSQVELNESWSGCKYLVGNARSEVATTTTEFVVSQDKGIGAELVDGLSDLFTTVVVEVLSSLGAARQKVTPGGPGRCREMDLELVANIEEQALIHLWP